MVVVLIVLCVVASVAILLSVAVYNSVVRKDMRADAAEERVHSLALKQGDLVSQLVSSVRAYGAAEEPSIRKVEHRLREAGAAKGTTAKLGACEELKKATSKLVEESSGCEEAMASSSFAELVAEINAGEEQIAAARTDFVNCVDAYNGALAAFPASVICGPKFRPRKGGSPKATASVTDDTAAADATNATQTTDTTDTV